MLGIKSKSYCTLLFQIPSDIRDRKVKTAGPQTERRIDSTYINSNWCLSRRIDSTYISSKLVLISSNRTDLPSMKLTIFGFKSLTVVSGYENASFHHLHLVFHRSELFLE